MAQTVKPNDDVLCPCPHCGKNLDLWIKRIIGTEHFNLERSSIQSKCDSCGEPIVISMSISVRKEGSESQGERGSLDITEGSAVD